MRSGHPCRPDFFAFFFDVRAGPVAIVTKARLRLQGWRRLGKKRSPRRVASENLTLASARAAASECRAFVAGHAGRIAADYATARGVGWAARLDYSRVRPFQLFVEIEQRKPLLTARLRNNFLCVSHSRKCHQRQCEHTPHDFPDRGCCGKPRGCRPGCCGTRAARHGKIPTGDPQVVFIGFSFHSKLLRNRDGPMRSGAAQAHFTAVARRDDETASKFNARR